jgi:hypothetical protein
MSAADEIVRRFLALYGEPRTPDPELYLAEYGKALSGYPIDALMTAADELIRASPFWPKPSEVIAKVDAELKWKARSVPPKAPEPRRVPTPEERERVAALMVEFRKAMAAITMEQQPHSDDVDWSRGQRGRFEAAQQASANGRLHRE